MKYPTQNKKFHAIEERCPCCGEVALESAYQPGYAGRAGYTLTHCKNPPCPMFTRTLRHEVFLEQANQSAQGRV